MAKLLRVRTGRFSLIPWPLEDGRLQLGYVETSRTDLVRDSFIGAAPLVAGGIFVTYAGLSRLGLSQLWDGFVASSLAGLCEGIRIVHQQPDFWLWFYLIFTVSSTMLPSASDRRAWGPLALILTLLAVVSLLAGAGPWLLQHVMPTLNKGLQVLVTVFGISLAIHFILVVPLWVIRLGFSRLIPIKVV